MYIFKSGTPSGADDEILSRSSKTSANFPRTVESALVRLQAPGVQAQIAVLSDAVAPTGLIMSSITEPTAVAGLVSTIGRPANLESLALAANESMMSSTATFDEAATASALQVSGVRATVLAISNLANIAIDQNVIQGNLQGLDTLQNLITPAGHSQFSIDVDLLAPTAPVLISELSDCSAAITLIDGAKENVRIVDFMTAQAASATFISTGLGTLIVTTPASNVSSLSLSGNVGFTATAIEVTSGITVSGKANSRDVSLYITGGAGSSARSSDVINLGSGQNTVILTGAGVDGIIQFGQHISATSDSVAVASNGVSTPEALSVEPLLTISGLNVGPNSSDKIIFLDDIENNLSWAGGSAQGAQVQSVSGDSGSLISWISAAQTQTSQAHSIAWFHFDGATYVLESAGGSSAAHVGDTLIKLTGTVDFSGVDGELAPGTLYLLG